MNLEEALAEIERQSKLIAGMDAALREIASTVPTIEFVKSGVKLTSFGTVLRLKQIAADARQGEQNHGSE